MKNIFRLLPIIFIFLSMTTSFAGKKNIIISTSEEGTTIYQDGKLLGADQAAIVILYNACTNIEVRKVGYLTQRLKFCNNKYSAKPPKTYFFEMKRDDSYDASVGSDIANLDIELKSSKNVVDAWKLISQIITSYFDVIEITDRETGYLRTSWSAQGFKQNSIRTRFIVKQYSSDPLVYKIKIVSEYSGSAGTSVKKDEQYREWDRVLRKYENVIPEMTTRLK